MVIERKYCTAEKLKTDYIHCRNCTKEVGDGECIQKLTFECYVCCFDYLFSGIKWGDSNQK